MHDVYYPYRGTHVIVEGLRPEISLAIVRDARTGRKSFVHFADLEIWSL